MKKVCVISATRAEYGLLYWTMKEIQKSTDLELQLLVTGMHLSPKFGNTWEVIEKDGFKIDEKIDLGELENSHESIANQMGNGVKGIFKAFNRMNPDLVIILGDRYEMLSAAQAALILNIPIAHIHGGEITEGAFDDAIRHAITKLSSIHFTTTETYKERVIQMGASPKRVFNIGAPGIENFKKLPLIDNKEFSKQVGFELLDKNLLITYHPVTAVEENGIKELLDALRKFPKYGQIITMPNSDPGHEPIFNQLNEYAKKRENVYITNSLGQIRYLSAMKICDAVIGNSSSGLLEAPFVGTATVNIGDRQKGRLSEDSVLHVPAKSSDIAAGITKAVNGKWEKSHLYGDGSSSGEIIKILETIDFKKRESFFDIRN